MSAETTPGLRRRRLRRWLGRAMLAVATLVAIPVVGFAVLWSRADTSNVGRLDFREPLRIPPLLEPTEDAAGRKVFRLRMREGTSELVSGTRTATWGFNGPYLGPTLRAARGETVRVQVTNHLPETSTVHWHGMHLPAHADGGPHQPIRPDRTWSPSWTIDQPAASLWYHPHRHGATEGHVLRGLAGMFILDDPVSRRLALPREYGTDDIPVIVQDARFDDDGRLSSSRGVISPLGRLGDEILVNGTHDPHLDVTTTRVRLRLLNASTARSYAFGLADGRRFALIATGGGLLDRPARLRRVQLSPGERAEIVVAVRPGERVVLRSFEPDLGADPFNSRFAGGDDSFDILQLRAARRLRASPRVPDRLAPRAAPDAAEAARVRRFVLGSDKINDRELDMRRVDQIVPVDTPEVWELRNRSQVPHNFHVHDTRFEVVDVDGRPPPPALGGPKDTVPVSPGQTVRVLVRFSDYTDPATPYMFHCHLLAHEDDGMMGQFTVVDRARIPRGSSSERAAAERPPRGAANLPPRTPPRVDSARDPVDDSRDGGPRGSWRRG